MKTSELIQHLQKLQDRLGNDPEIQCKVKDQEGISRTYGIGAIEGEVTKDLKTVITLYT